MIREMSHFSATPDFGSSYLMSPTMVTTDSFSPTPWMKRHHPNHNPHEQDLLLASPPDVHEYSDESRSLALVESAVLQGSSLPLPSQTGPGVTRKKLRKASKSSYKHVPHREKPPHLVARRNARERRRVQAVNTAFARLRKCVPAENRNKRLSKVKTLHRAIEYIQTLQEMLQRADEELDVRRDTSLHGIDDLIDGEASSLNKENEMNERWLPVTMNWDSDTHDNCISFYDDFPDHLQS